MSNIEKVKTNPVVLTGGLALQKTIISELDKSAEEVGQEFTPYGKQCMINAITGIINICRNQGIDMKSVDATLLKLQIQNIGYTELNIATNPAEVYVDMRKSKNDKGDWIYSVSIKPQGAGNEKLVRKYGVGIRKDFGLHNCWLVREGDEFTYPYFDGLKMTPPSWRPKSYDSKVIMVVYPCEKVDGSVEYLIATREGIKPNLIAQIRQSTLHSFKKKAEGSKYEIDDEEARNEFYERINTEFESMSVDEILKNPEWRSYLTPTYTSGGSVEAMILRKMKNNALKNYPKEYDNSMIRDSVVNMFEDNDDSLKTKKSNDIIANAEDLDSNQEENAPLDFTVNDDGVVEREESNEKEVEATRIEEDAKSIDNTQEEKSQEEESKGNCPDW